MSKEFSVLRESVVKVDSIDKVRGTAKFSADISFDDMLYGGVFRSKVCSATIKKLDISKAQAHPGVACVLTYKDIPNSNRIGIIIKDEPVLVDDKVRRYGDAIAIVAADTPERVNEALELIEVEYDEIEPIFTIERAAEEDSPKVHGESNLLQHKELTRGDVDEAFENSYLVVENTYQTSMYSHMFIEPDAGLARYENGIMTLYSSTQNAHFDRGEVARMLGIPNNRVRNKQMTTGGGFGGKLDISVQCHAALLAHYTGHTIKMVRTRKESTMVSSKRHPMKMIVKTGVDKDGKIQAVDFKMYGDTGAYASYGPAVITRAVVHASGPYNVPNIRITADFYYTNNPMAGAFRGFGVPQVAVAHEGQMNEIANRLGISKFEIRKRNGMTVGSKICTDQILTESVGYQDTITAAEKKMLEVMKNDKQQKLPPHKKVGYGVGSMWYGVGNTGLPNPSAAFIEVLSDASVNLIVGCADIGQGSSTVCAQIAAEELGLSFEDIHVTSADTAVAPEGGATSASRQTFVSGNATRNAAKQAKGTLAECASGFLNVPAEDLIFKNHEIYSATDPEKKMTYKELMAQMGKQGKLAVGAGSYNPKTTYLDAKTMAGVPFEVYSFATTVVEVIVDTETGLVDTKKVVSAHDVGTVINKAMAEGQIEGGVVMGQGFSLLEAITVKDGVITNPQFSKYLIQTSEDAPEIYPVLVESEGEAGPFGAKGLGEPALIPTIPACADAVEDAIGIKFTKLPITPTDILRELKKKRESATQ